MLEAISSTLKSIVRKILHILSIVYYTLKKQVGEIFLHPGFVAVWIPVNPCPFCGTEIERCTNLLRLKGWTVIEIKVDNEKSECCQILADLKKSVKQEVLLTK